VGYASQEEGGNLIITEQTLIEPCFRCYVLIDFSLDSPKSSYLFSRLYENLKSGEAHYIPYLGKNEFQASWMDDSGKILFKEYSYFEEAQPDKDFIVSSLFSDDENISPIMDSADDDDFVTPFFYFEHLPYQFHEQLLQYDFKLFKYTNALLKVGEGNSKIKHLHQIGQNKYVYLF
jgi:CRISPR-associated protein Cas5h